MKKNITRFNLDLVKICLIQSDDFFDKLSTLYAQSHGNDITFNGFYLRIDETKINDKDITAKLFISDIDAELGTFVFNNSKKFGKKCFYTYNTKSLYDTDGYVFTGINSPVIICNYFNYSFYAFQQLGLEFNNVTHLEIACDTEVNVINRLRYMISNHTRFDMILLRKKVENPEAPLEGFYEFYQRSRVKKIARPTIYIHPRRESGNYKELKIYDKARELAESRADKEELIRAWNGMVGNIQRLEISVENVQFKRFYAYVSKWHPDKYENIEHFFMDLGTFETLRMQMFHFFANLLLHFKIRNHDKTQVSLLDISVYNLTKLKNI